MLLIKESKLSQVEAKKYKGKVKFCNAVLVGSKGASGGLIMLWNP